MPRYRRAHLAAHLADLADRGITSRRDQARALGVGYSTLMRHLSQAGLTTPRGGTLRAWIPWVVAEKHHYEQTARNLRLLAQAAEGRNTKYRVNRGVAVQWAKRLIDQDLDITYDREQGFHTIPAQPHDWYLKALVTAAEEYILSLPQLDDLGKHPER